MLPLIVLHSTEGSTASGALQTLKANNTMSHDVLDVKNRQVHSLLPYDQPARALKDLPGGVLTNRRGAVVQVEIVGFAARSTANAAGAGSKAPVIPEFNNDDLTFLAHYLRWLCAVTGAPYTFLRTFQPYPQSYGDTGNRFSPQEWLTAAGICGHMHVPENVHGDPGALNTAFLEKVGLSIPVQEAPDMTPAEFAHAIGAPAPALDGVIYMPTSQGDLPLATVLAYIYDEIKRPELLVQRVDDAISDETLAAGGATAKAVADELAARLAQ